MSEDSDVQRAAVSTRTVELVVAAVLLCFGALVVYDSVRLGFRWADDGPQAGYFPFYIGSFICICAALLIGQALLGRTSGPRVFVSREALRRVLSVLVPGVLYVLGIQLIGIYVASVLYISIFMVWLGGYRWAPSLAISVAVMAAFYGMFEVWFKVALFKGLFDPLSFLGH